MFGPGVWGVLLSVAHATSTCTDAQLPVVAKGAADTCVGIALCLGCDPCRYTYVTHVAGYPSEAAQVEARERAARASAASPSYPLLRWVHSLNAAVHTKIGRPPPITLCHMVRRMQAFDGGLLAPQDAGRLMLMFAMRACLADTKHTMRATGVLALAQGMQAWAPCIPKLQPLCDALAEVCTEEAACAALRAPSPAHAVLVLMARCVAVLEPAVALGPLLHRMYLCNGPIQVCTPALMTHPRPQAPVALDPAQTVRQWWRSLPRAPLPPRTAGASGTPAGVLGTARPPETPGSAAARQS